MFVCKRMLLGFFRDDVHEGFPDNMVVIDSERESILSRFSMFSSALVSLRLFRRWIRF